MNYGTADLRQMALWYSAATWPWRKERLWGWGGGAMKKKYSSALRSCPIEYAIVRSRQDFRPIFFLARKKGDLHPKVSSLNFKVNKLFIFVDSSENRICLTFCYNRWTAHQFIGRIFVRNWAEKSVWDLAVVTRSGNWKFQLISRIQCTVDVHTPWSPTTQLEVSAL